jgi:adenosylmethionine-8-amino-7-oxononanoate aminotransferase
MISSWWTSIHGHSHDQLNEALAEQSRRLPHIMFAGFTHSPAVELAERLVDVLPAGLTKVFYSDNGSTAVEAALKIAYQFWRNEGETDRDIFLGFDGGYHGDTFGAMSVGRASGFFNLFEDLMCAVKIVPFAETWEGDDDAGKREGAALEALASAVKEARGRIAALIVEPMMQGAGGFRFCRPDFLRALCDMAREDNILVIFDEVATGFGRTGKMFACEHAGVTPDIICLAKGLAGGYLPLAATVAHERIYAAFLDESFEKALAHGHTFTANPLACAVALRSLALFEEENTFERIVAIERQHRSMLPDLAVHGEVSRARLLGTVLAFNLADRAGTYKSEASLFLKDWYLAHGLNIRPLGPVIYLMPPYCITPAELERAYECLFQGLDALKSAS